MGKGYLAVAGFPMHVNIVANGNNIHYLANLVSLACMQDNSVVLDVPSFKQGLFPYDGKDPVWENDTYDDGDKQDLWCGTTMGECACAETSATMVMRYNNIDKLWWNQEIDPSSTNSYFNQFSKYNGSYYQSYGYSNGNVNWDAVSYLSADSETVFSNQPKLGLPKREDYNFDKVRAYIDGGTPVILKVKYYTKDNDGNDVVNYHWVVVRAMILIMKILLLMILSMLIKLLAILI